MDGFRTAKRVYLEEIARIVFTSILANRTADRSGVLQSTSSSPPYPFARAARFAAIRRLSPSRRFRASEIQKQPPTLLTRHGSTQSRLSPECGCLTSDNSRSRNRKQAAADVRVATKCGDVANYIIGPDHGQTSHRGCSGDSGWAKLISMVP